MADAQNKYDTDSIVWHNWPKMYQKSDGNWERIWEITLKEPQSKAISLSELEKQLSDREKWVTLALDGKELRVTITTIRWGLEDDLFFYYYKVLEHLNDKLGEIDKIQRQERNLWPPWLWVGSSLKLRSLDYYLVNEK